MAGERLAEQILPNAMSMLAVSLTSVGLVKVAEGYIGPSSVDECCAVVSVAFLVASMLSYVVLRYDEDHPVAVVIERIADILFMGGLVALTGVILLFAYELV